MTFEEWRAANYKYMMFSFGPEMTCEDAWQAARRATLEECAVLADDANRRCVDQRLGTMCLELAAKIRALAEEGQGE